jgi:hypothetical protein
MACEMCWHPSAPTLHNEGCPMAGGSQSEYDRGYVAAFNGDFIPWWELRHYSASFQYGYRVGKSIIEHLIDEEIAARINGY